MLLETAMRADLTTLQTASRFLAGRGRIQVGIEGSITNPDAILVEESEILLKERWRWCTWRNGAVQNVKTILVHVDRDKCTRLVGVGELYAASFDAVAVGERVVRHLAIPLKVARDGIVERASQVVHPAVRARVGISLAALGLVGVNLLPCRVIDDGDGVAVRTVLDCIHARGQGNAEFRRVRDLAHYGLAGEIDDKAVLLTCVFDPALSGGRSRHQHEHRDRNEWTHTHDLSSRLLEFTCCRGRHERILQRHRKARKPYRARITG